jgi:DNA gyrase subunit B
MTDADVDGSHIRTLLLTFFFRQMPELIRRGHIYIAQPPLYQIAKAGAKASNKKKGTYVLNEKFLDDALMDLGLESCALVVRDITPKGEAVFDVREVRRLEGQPLKRVIATLRRVQELIEIASRRGVPFDQVLAQREQDPTGKKRLPTHRVSWRGGEEHAWSEQQALEVVAKRKLRLIDHNAENENGTNGNGAATGGPAVPVAIAATVRELHENRELDKLFAELEASGVPVNVHAYTAQQAETVTGEKAPTRFAWVATGDVQDEVGSEPEPSEDDGPQETGRTPARPAARGKVVDTPNLPSILSALREIGRRGLEVKRFKGLGEMDAEQLWETTMDVQKRTLLKVSSDAASQADALFTILMGEEVEPRRKFIEDHALEVKNLDV